MARALYSAVFIAIALSVLGGVHYYLWARLVRDAAWPATGARAGAVALTTAAVSLPIAFALGRLWPSVIPPVAVGAAYVWMAMAFLIATALGVLDLGRLLGSLGTWIAGLVGGDASAPVDPGRRLFLARAAAGATATAMTAVGLRSALGEIEVREVPVKLARLPRALSGTTLVQITDLHVGPTIGRRFVEGVVEKANLLKPDLVAITGDLVDGSVPALRGIVEPLARLRARFGTFFVTGNHEYYTGVEPWVAELARMGIRVLDNERVSVGDAAASFDLAGVPDPTSGRYLDRPPDLAKALAGRDPEREVVLLAHQPKAIAEAAKLGVGLQLSGHTHGGQIWPFSAVVALTQPYLAGFHRHGDTYVYVSCGTGYWGPPVRLGAPAEITRIVLV